MPQQKSVLVATIGTRDLIFKITSGEWYNVGDDRMQNGAIIGEQAEVLSDLGFPEKNYRDLTQHLLEDFDLYRDCLKPVIFGKVIVDHADEISRIYLVATNQKDENIKEREKDTLYAAEIIKSWLIANFQNFTDENVTILSLGEDGTNPSNFEQMFRWWQRVWRQNITVKPDEGVWVCLKGGVGQASEAARVSGLSWYSDRIQFFEFKASAKNRQGVPSDYTGPFLGTNYLWDRTQQQALRLLERFDYDEVYVILEPYFRQDSKGFGSLPSLIQAGIAWNQGNFQKFFNLVKSQLQSFEIRQAESWWWMGYEQAQLAVVRLEQQNTPEAMLHSYRAVEGTLYLWANSQCAKKTDRSSRRRAISLNQSPSMSNPCHN